MRYTALVLAALILVACDSPTEPPTLQALSVSVAPGELEIGETATATATAHWSDGSESANPAGVQWSSADESVVTVSQAGVITATGGGTGRVRATLEGVTGEANVVVAFPPAEVVVVEASARLRSQNEEVTVHLKNEGGPGVYRVEFWGLPTSPGGPETFYGESEAIAVAHDYDEIVTWAVPVGFANFPRVRRIEVYTRDEGSAAYRKTDEYRMPDEYAS